MLGLIDIGKWKFQTHILSQVADNGFRQEDFDLVAGQTKYKLDRVAPGANASHTVVVRPKKFGYFNFTAAEVGNNHDFNLLSTILILESALKNPNFGICS